MKRQPKRKHQPAITRVDNSRMRSLHSARSLASLIGERVCRMERHILELSTLAITAPPVMKAIANSGRSVRSRSRQLLRPTAVRAQEMQARERMRGAEITAATFFGAIAFTFWQYYIAKMCKKETECEEDKIFLLAVNTGSAVSSFLGSHVGLPMTIIDFALFLRKILGSGGAGLITVIVGLPMAWLILFLFARKLKQQLEKFTHAAGVGQAISSFVCAPDACSTLKNILTVLNTASAGGSVPVALIAYFVFIRKRREAKVIRYVTTRIGNLVYTNM